MEQHYSNLFVVVMGMGVTFVGLTAIIFLTQLMGTVITALDRKKPQNAAPAASAAPAAAPTPAVSGDGIEDAVKIAIVAALAQDPAFRLDHVTRIDIRRV